MFYFLLCVLRLSHGRPGQIKLSNFYVGLTIKALEMPRNHLPWPTYELCLRVSNSEHLITITSSMPKSNYGRAQAISWPNSTARLPSTMPA